MAQIIKKVKILLYIYIICNIFGCDEYLMKYGKIIDISMHSRVSVHLLWVQPSLFFNGYRGVKRLGREVDG